MEKLKVFIGDLTHTTTVISSDVIPINIGYLAEYARKILGNKVEFTLFKYPDKLIRALKKERPHVLALSAYPWNRNISLSIMEFYNTIDDNHINVFGGPDFPLPERKDQQLEFFQKNQQVDYFIPGEAEIPFVDICTAILERGIESVKKKEGHIKATICLKDRKLFYVEDDLYNTVVPVMDDIPSPYLSGRLDEFFDDKLSPYIQQNRNCPFSCTFCRTGNTLFTKMRFFSEDRIRAECEYICKKVQKSGGPKGLLFSDTNFGMYTRDLELCKYLAKLRQKTGFPQYVAVTWGKNNKKTILECMKVLAEKRISAAVQSADNTVLDNIKRSRFDEKEYFEMINEIHKFGSVAASEIILGLPGETKESHIRTIDTLIRAGVDYIVPYTLMLIRSSEMDTPETIEKYKFVIKNRIVPRDFGTYEGVGAFETERVVIATKDLSFEEYLEMRKLHLLVKTVFFEKAYDALLNYAKSYGIQMNELVHRCFKELDNAPHEVKLAFNKYMEDTKSELWDSEDALVAFYNRPENYNKLVSGELGGNLIQQYSAMLLNTRYLHFGNFIASVISEMIKERHGKVKVEQMEELLAFLSYRTSGVFQPVLLDDLSMHEFNYDIQTWLYENDRIGVDDTVGKLDNYRKPVNYKFYYGNEKKQQITALFNQFGTTDQHIGKILARDSLLTFFRDIENVSEPQIVAKITPLEQQLVKQLATEDYER
ncbi:TPA: radical SAM protein [archaeon]|uniref:Radical SAM protein n=1 Tax=Candidatus Naiadarchaeum limnaeum TaxID=2756139 RepID=A0A832V0Z7_9ARCH|nr:radical SAM protein [Candidatus Naiadarchaeales archaeon SRR2090153.bin1042]HIJ99927.1 radical SAM protein [Candidatus Naiadarchaeum limnaeum]